MVWAFSRHSIEQIPHFPDDLMRFPFYMFKASRSLPKNLLQDSCVFRNPGKSGLYWVAWGRMGKLISPHLYFQHICAPCKSSLLTQFSLLSWCTQRKEKRYLIKITNYRKQQIDLCGKKRQPLKLVQSVSCHLPRCPFPLTNLRT